MAKLFYIKSKSLIMASRPTSVKSSSSSSAAPEDEFYNNLTLNLIQFLNNIPRITSVTLHKQQPCERTAVATFEQRHNVFLPDDMKRFYLSTDGFTLHWCYQYARKLNCPFFFSLYLVCTIQPNPNQPKIAHTIHKYIIFKAIVIKFMFILACSFKQRLYVVWVT